GVCVGIGAWNYPQQIACWKGAPALVAGNAMVFKPSENTPLGALKIAEILIEAGLPNGLYNVIQGDRSTGPLLVNHPDVAKVSLTGSVPTGKKVAGAAAAELKHVTMELGGKSPHVVFGDVDIEHAVNGVVSGVFAAAGQTCVAGSRCFVEASVYDRFIDALVARTQRIRVGLPTADDTDIGPLALADQLSKVEAYVASGVEEGAKVAVGGGRPQKAELAPGGWYFEPTVMVDAGNDMAFMRDELFGPVVGVMPFRSEEEMIELANDTRYGLASGIWTKDIDRALRFANRIEAGTVWINTYRSASFMSANGGFRESGYGRRGGFEVMYEFSRLKNVIIDYSGTMQDPFVIRLK
ncbi:MAG TPA: aldehyde dehydrogenase family protein, partial [Shinella sp.]|nr:aldehyde dehydrogenase family protein [Shinella sp.]